MANIKNIIFDLGGVFIEIDYFKTENAFIDLGVANFSELYSQYNASELFEELETGKIEPATFYDKFRNMSRTELSNDQIEIAWNAMLGDVIIANVELLQMLKNQFNIYLFSNTNIIHYKAFQKTFIQKIPNNSFDSNFIAAWYSHNLGLRKPYPESFTALLRKEKLEAGETLFIDDTIKNIEGAKAAGLQTFHLKKPSDLVEFLKSIT